MKVSQAHALDFGPSVLVAVLGIVAACMGPVSSARATVVQAVSFDAQCATAERIFVGTVRGVDSRRNAARPRYFETLVTFAVEEVVAGDVPPVLELRFAGGRIGNQVQSIDGMPAFVAGERYVVFVDAEGEAPLASPIVGFNQGLYRVVQEESEDRVRVLVRDRDGKLLPTSAAVYRAVFERRAGRPGGAAIKGADGVTTEPELDAFVAAIRAARKRSE